jgi:predicted nucleic acid-binding protein
VIKTFYLDSSALVKRYALEAGSDWVRALCGEPDHIIAVALIGLVEVTAAVAGKLRGGRLDQATADVILDSLKAHAVDEYTLLDVDQYTVNEAMQLALRRGLRGYDAVHLASALRLNRTLVGMQSPSLILVAADADLLGAAQAEGLQTENPHLYP